MLYFVTGNQYKIASAKHALAPFHIDFESTDLPLIEIQSDSIEEIAKHKAKQAFDKLHKPLIIKDDGWSIEALHGFPGPYMKFVNQWFTVEDYQNLLRKKENKRVIFTEAICFTDGNEIKVFSEGIVGRVLDTPSGVAEHPFMKLVTFRKDGLSMAQADNEEKPQFDKRNAWELFAKWYKTIE